MTSALDGVEVINRREHQKSYPNPNDPYFPRNVGLAYFKFEELGDQPGGVANSVRVINKNKAALEKLDFNTIPEDVVQFVNDIFQQVERKHTRMDTQTQTVQVDKQKNLLPSPQISASSVNSEDRFVNEILPEGCTRADLDPYLDIVKTESPTSDEEFVNSILPDEQEISILDPLAEDMLEKDKQNPNIPKESENLKGSEEESETSSKEESKPSLAQRGLANTAYEPDETGGGKDLILAQGDSQGGSRAWEELQKVAQQKQECIAQNEVLLRQMCRYRHLPGKPDSTQITSYDMEMLNGMSPNQLHQAAELLAMQENECKDEYVKLQRSVPNDKLNCCKEFEAQKAEIQILQSDRDTLAADASLQKRPSRMKRARNFFLSCFGLRRRRNR